jgi:hypothetical protein
MVTEPIRVLIEHQNPRVLTRHAKALSDAGFHVEVCPGPSAFDDRLCPLVAGRGCGPVERADVILNGLPLGNIEVFIAQRRTFPGTPTQLTLSEGERARVPVLHHVADVIPRGLDPGELVGVVRRAYHRVMADLDGV